MGAIALLSYFFTRMVNRIKIGKEMLAVAGYFFLKKLKLLTSSTLPELFPWCFLTCVVDALNLMPMTDERPRPAATEKPMRQTPTIATPL